MPSLFIRLPLTRREAEIGQEVGFCDQSYLALMFLTLLHMIPREYRRNLEKAKAAASARWVILQVIWRFPAPDSPCRCRPAPAPNRFRSPGTER